MKKLLVLMAAAALMFAGCSKQNAQDDPSKVAGPINKQWSMTIPQLKFTEYDVVDLTTLGKIKTAYTRDPAGSWTITIDTAIDSIKYTNTEKTAGTIYYKNKMGTPTSYAFKEATESTIKFEAGASGSGMFQTWEKSNYVLE